MFKNLTDFSYTRNRKEALGFYLAYFLVGVMAGSIVGALSGIQSGAATFSEGLESTLTLGAIVGVVYSLLVGTAVLMQKKLYRHFGNVLLVLLSGLLAVFGGALLGLIIPAYLTTRENLQAPHAL